MPETNLHRNKIIYLYCKERIFQKKYFSNKELHTIEKKSENSRKTCNEKLCSTYNDLREDEM